MGSTNLPRAIFRDSPTHVEGSSIWRESYGMKRIDGTTIVAYWLIACGALALARLIARADEIFAHPGAWRAAAGPLIVALLGFGAAWRLLRDRRAVRIPTVLLCAQLIALSVGPLAYRLDVGPFLRLGLGAFGIHANAGSDARLLLVLGSGNRIPPGLAVNALALVALAILFSAHRATTCSDDPY